MTKSADSIACRSLFADFAVSSTAYCPRVGPLSPVSPALVKPVTLALELGMRRSVCLVTLSPICAHFYMRVRSNYGPLRGKVVTRKQNLPTIDDWMEGNTLPELIVVATTDFSGEDRVFETQCGKVVDTVQQWQGDGLTRDCPSACQQKVYESHIVR